MRTQVDNAATNGIPSDPAVGFTTFIRRDANISVPLPFPPDFHQSAARMAWFQRNRIDARLVYVTLRDRIVCTAILEKIGDGWFLWKGPAGDVIPGALDALLDAFADLAPVTLVLQPQWRDTQVLRRGGFSALPPFCTLLASTVGSAHDILRRMKTMTRRGVLRGQRVGLQFLEEPAGIGRFYPIYSVAMTNAGSPDFATFEQLASLLEIQGVHLFLATHADEVVAGSICFENQNSLEARYVATHPKYRHLAPLHWLHFETLLYAARLERSYFDLSGIATGAVTHKLAGINRFKEGFGGNLYEYPVFVREVPQTSASLDGSAPERWQP